MLNKCRPPLDLHTLRLYLGDSSPACSESAADDLLLVILLALPKLQYSHGFQFNTVRYPRLVVAPLTLMKNGTHRRPPLQRSVESAVRIPRMGDLILEGQYSYIFALRPPFHRKHRSCCRWFWLDMSHAVVGAAQRLHRVL